MKTIAANLCVHVCGRANSHVGVQQDGKIQTMCIGSGFKQVSTVTHEIFHLLGRNHEQCRTDRDQYVVVNWKNIKQGEM